MKNEATIMMHVIGNETDEEILEVSKQIISLSKHMNINLKIVRVEPVQYEKIAEHITSIDNDKYNEYTNTESDCTKIATTITNKHDDSLDAHLYSQYIVDQIMG